MARIKTVASNKKYANFLTYCITGVYKKFIEYSCILRLSYNLLLIKDELKTSGVLKPKQKL